MNEWRCLDVRVIHDDMFRVEEHDIETADGRSFTMPFLTGPDCAIVVPVRADGRIAFVRQHRYGIGELVELPGGCLDPGETPEQAARRETWEEAGLRCGEMIPLGCFPGLVGVGCADVHGFVALDCEFDATAPVDADCQPVAVHVEDPHRFIARERPGPEHGLMLLLAWPHILRRRGR